MNVIKNITINLSEENVKEIIAEYCKKNGYEVKTDNIKLVINRRCVGYGSMEHDEWYFDGARVDIKEGNSIL